MKTADMLADTVVIPTQSVFVMFELIWDIEHQGARNEQRASKAFNGTFEEVPLWLLRIENTLPNSNKDRAGIDIFVHTDIGRFPIQIKSSDEKALKFREDQRKGRYSKKIMVVVILEDYGPAKVRQVILDVIIPAYRAMVGKVAAEHGARFIAA